MKKNFRFFSKCLLIVSLMLFACIAANAARTAGPLRVHHSNPRYFMDKNETVILLTGSHTWNNYSVDIGEFDPPALFNFKEYINFLKTNNHNFIRGWTWELPKGEAYNTFKHIDPNPWQRTGPGVAYDGKLKFDLTKFNHAYFDRLRQRAVIARDNGIYVSIMLFEGWALRKDNEARYSHPFRGSNNINGIHYGSSILNVHTLNNRSIVDIQEDYVKKVIDSVNDLDNILFEISNESGKYSREWQYHLVDFIKTYETAKAKQHPVGMTYQSPDGSTQDLFSSLADWISPGNDGGNYKSNPPASNGSKVIIVDTDHLWGIGGNAIWVWKSFMRGLNPIFMDAYKDSLIDSSRFISDENEEGVRKAMGDVQRVSEYIDLASMVPRGELSSTGYCLANPGKEYVSYHTGGVMRIDLTGASGTFIIEWYITDQDRWQIGGTVQGGGWTAWLKPPAEGVVVLRLSDR